jgi:ATP-dependent DNA ligase
MVGMAPAVRPPLAPMLARVAAELPGGKGWLYEPKWDGFRAIVFSGDGFELISRDGRPLNRYFPELVDALADVTPPDSVIDGEIVVAGDEGLDFDALLLRIHPAQSRVDLLARDIPASFVVFDLIALDDRDLTDIPLKERRSELRRVLPTVEASDPQAALRRIAEPGSHVVLTPQTSDRDVALDWFTSLERLGIDGIIAKTEDSLYVPGKRIHVKYKHRRTADCVVGGYRLAKSGDGIGSLLLGLYDTTGVLQYVGHTSAFKAHERRDLLKTLRALEGGRSFGEGRAPGGPSRWTGGRDVSWVPLEPRLVCEVSFDHLQGERFRHAAGFIRWRDDKAPEECTFDQLGR